MRGQPMRALYRDGRMPIPVTLGALIVLDAAQRSQDRGSRREEILDDATSAAARFLDLVSVLPDVARRPRSCAIRCGISSSIRCVSLPPPGWSAANLRTPGPDMELRSGGETSSPQEYSLVET